MIRLGASPVVPMIIRSLLFSHLNDRLRVRPFDASHSDIWDEEDEEDEGEEDEADEDDEDDEEDEEDEGDEEAEGDVS